MGAHLVNVDDAAEAVDLVPIVAHARNPVVWEAGTVEDAGDAVTTKTIKNHVRHFIIQPKVIILRNHLPAGSSATTVKPTITNNTLHIITSTIHTKRLNIDTFSAAAACVTNPKFPTTS